ncbi:MAG: type III-B CRISPR module-associated protein Cmr3 [Deltaproteobacteria bacterium]|nr:type III-B CRISPR module-associated protein Cmr3 [Deltaproteobacteria bacterium]
MKSFFIEPNDTLFFRGGDPMGMGESHDIDFRFPPGKETFIGAVRSWLLALYCKRFKRYINECKNCEKLKECKIKEIVGKSSDKPKFNLYGPLLVKKEKNSLIPLFVPPKNIFVDNNYNTIKLLPVKVPGITDLEDLYLPFHKSVEDSEPINGYLTDKGMEKIVSKNGKINLKDNIISNENIYSIEERVGIALERRTRKTKERMIYFTRHIRFKQDIGFYIEIEGADNLLPDKGIIALGGENRTCDIYKVKPIKLPNTKKIENNKISLITLFPQKININKGIFPSWIDEKREGIIPNTMVKVKVVSIFSDKPEYVGGFDMVKKMSKPIEPYIPAGTVYFSEIIEGNKEELLTQKEFIIGGW